MEFSDTVKIKSVFGEIEIVFHPEQKAAEASFESVEEFLNSTPRSPSYYRATLISGEYSGMWRDGAIRQAAIYDLLSAAAE